MDFRKRREIISYLLVCMTHTLAVKRCFHDHRAEECLYWKSVSIVQVDKLSEF